MDVINLSLLIICCILYLVVGVLWIMQWGWKEGLKALLQFTIAEIIFLSLIILISTKVIK